MDPESCSGARFPPAEGELLRPPGVERDVEAVLAPREAVGDGDLLTAARAGDREALASLVDRHKDTLVAFLVRMTGSRERAEDLAQETFLRLFERGGRYREQGRLKSYLFRIALNLVRSRERQRARRRALRLAYLPADVHQAPPRQTAELLRDEERRLVAQAIAELPLPFRTPLVLFELEGWSYRDIGEATGCREGTVKSRIHRGRQRLKERLRPYWEGEAAR